ncbi:MAG TPA: DUF424 family protein [archaeon]|nr:DUF424 family protein [archaeon]
MKNLFCKLHSTQNSTVLACCDEDVLGKNFSDEKYDVSVDEHFYKGEKVGEEQMIELLASSDSINLFGKESVAVAIKQGFISKSDIIRIAGVEHAIIIKV